MAPPCGLLPTIGATGTGAAGLHAALTRLALERTQQPDQQVRVRVSW